MVERGAVAGWGGPGAGGGDLPAAEPARPGRGGRGGPDAGGAAVPAIRGRGPGALRRVAGRSGAPTAGRGGPSGAALTLGEVSFAPALARVALSSDRSGRHGPARAGVARRGGA